MTVTWFAQTIVTVLAVLGLTLDDLPKWAQLVLVLVAIVGAGYIQFQHHTTLRVKSDNAAAVAIRQAGADKAKHDALLAQVQLARHDALSARRALNGAPASMIQQAAAPPIAPTG